MNILTDILNLFKRKKFVHEDLKPDDVFVVGIHKEPEMEGIASPKPYKSVKLAKLSKLSSFLGKVSIREPENAPVGEYNDTSLISVAKQTSKPYGGAGLNVVNKRLILDGQSTGNTSLNVNKTQLTSNFKISNNTHSVNIANNVTDLVHMGSGTLNLFGNSNTVVRLAGDTAKNIINLQGNTVTLNVEDTSTTDILNVVGYGSFINVVNPSADITKLIGLNSVINLIEPLSHFSDVRSVSITTNGESLANIDDYYGIYNDVIVTNATNAHFIYSLQDAPSFFAGELQAKSFKLNDLNNTVLNSTDPGEKGEVRIDENFIYVCVDDNTWKRTQLQSW